MYSPVISDYQASNRRRWLGGSCCRLGVCQIEDERKINKKKDWRSGAQPRERRFFQFEFLN